MFCRSKSSIIPFLVDEKKIGVNLHPFLLQMIFTLERCYVKRFGLTFTRCNRSNWKVFRFGSEASEGKIEILSIYLFYAMPPTSEFIVFFSLFIYEQLCGAQLLDVCSTRFINFTRLFCYFISIFPFVFNIYFKAISRYSVLYAYWIGP